MQGAAEPPPPLALRPRAALEILLAVENERDRLLDAEPLALFLHEARYRFDERRLVGRDDLDEVALQRGKVLHFRDLPRAAHIGLRARAGSEHGLLLLVVELLPQLHRPPDHLRAAH